MTIKELRQMKGLTLAAFAESIGIGMSTLTGYEAGKRQPSAKALAAVKEVYGVDLNDTLSPTGDAPAPDEKKARKPHGKKEAPAPAVKKAEEKKSRKPRAKKEAAPTTVEEKVEKKAEKKTSKQLAKIIIQSLMGGEITPEEILSRIGDVDKVYIKVEENAAYWVKGDETGAINIW